MFAWIKFWILIVIRPREMKLKQIQIYTTNLMSNCFLFVFKKINNNSESAIFVVHTDKVLLLPNILSYQLRMRVDGIDLWK